MAKPPSGPGVHRTGAPIITGWPDQRRHSPDATRADFLRRVDSAPFALSEWEVGFLENNIGRVCYSSRQRMVIDELRRKYEARL